ncbi:V-type ATPase 116kDa subunit family protein [Candidatus Pyrohabitans sp.]
MLKLFCIIHESALEPVLEQLQRMACIHFFNVREYFKFLTPVENRMEEISVLEERISELLSDLRPEGKMSFLERLLGPKVVPVEILERAESLDVIEGEVEQVEITYLTFCEKLSEVDGELRRIEEEMDAIKREAIDIEALPEDSALKRMYVELVQERAAMERCLMEIEAELSLFKKESYPHMLALKERIKNIKLRAEALEKFGRSRSTIFFAGWVPERDRERVGSAVEEAADGLAILEFYPPTSDESPPILLENPRVIKPYEVLTTAYGLPEYNGIDPTPILAITFTAMFGMMFADVGYGLALSLLSLLLYLLTTYRERVLKDVNLIVFYAGTASVFFGLLAGEFFGGLLEIRPLLGSYLQNLQLLLVLSFLLGLTHISISLISRVLSLKDVGYPISLLLILWGSAAYLVLPQFRTPSTVILIAGLGLLAKDRGVEALEELIALAANVISYARVGALAVIHVTMARLLVEAVETIPGGVAGVILTAIIFALGAVFILASGTFIVFIQSLRLHWLEFFRRFYSGKGEMFKPLAYISEYTYML